MSEISSGVPSPRLQLLRDAIANGQTDALLVFWIEVAESGVPLIEPIPGDGNYRLVTFLWRGAPGTRRVSVRLNLSTGAPLDSTHPDLAASPARFLPGTGTDPQASDPMTPLPGTDLWYFTWRFPHDLRTRYWFLVDDTPPQSDPLNPQFIVAPKRGEGQEAAKVITSVIALPAAPAQSWSELPLGAAAGRVEHLRYTSAILGNERSIWVYTPVGYDAGAAPYPLLLLFDGWELMQIPPTITFLDAMRATGVLPPMIAVMVDSIDAQTRTREDCCHPPFRDFLVDELLPWVHQRYQVPMIPRR